MIRTVYRAQNSTIVGRDKILLNVSYPLAPLPTGAVLGSSLSYVTIEDVDKNVDLREGYCNPTMHPTSLPTIHPSHAPTLLPSLDPTAQPSPTPTSHPTVSPTTEKTTKAQVHSVFALAGVSSSSVGPAEKESLKDSIVSSVAIATKKEDIAALNVSDTPMEWPPARLGVPTSRRFLSVGYESATDVEGGSGGGGGGGGMLRGHARELQASTTYVYFTLAFDLETHPAYQGHTGNTDEKQAQVLSDLKTQLTTAVTNGNL